MRKLTPDETSAYCALVRDNKLTTRTECENAMQIVIDESDRRSGADRRESMDVEAIVNKRADARFADQRVAERRRKPRQTQAMFIKHVEAYCAKKKGRS